MKKLLVLLLASAALLAGCEKDDPKGKPFPEPADWPFECYYLENRSMWKNLSDQYPHNGELVVVNSDPQMRDYVSGDYPPIDFTKKTLLVTRVDIPVSISHPTCDFVQISTNSYRFDVSVYPGALQAPSYWVFAILVDKLSSESQVELNVETNDPKP